MTRGAVASPATPPGPVIVPAMDDRQRAALLAWYDARGRSIAFRSSRDPYAILVSEVMAQQTQISRVVPAWERFIERFPTVEALARSTPADVLRAWQGMGYDRRALNLRRAAIAIHDRYDGVLPASIADLEQLPGIGPYTARAVAAIAFGQPVGAVDTNVRRVLGRVLATLTDGRSTQATADASVDRERPADWTHALMDLGATICRPRRPRCPDCPLASTCRSPTLVSGDPATLGRTDPIAAPQPPGRSASRVPFPATTRWLRGRIVDRLRAGAGETWIRIDGPIGSHDPTAVGRALAALAADGLVEVDPADPLRARLATV